MTNSIPYKYVYKGDGHSSYLSADDSCFVYFYLPNGRYEVEKNGVMYVAEVNDGESQFVPMGENGSAAVNTPVTGGGAQMMTLKYPFAPQVMLIQNGEVFRPTGDNEEGYLSFLLPKTGDTVANGSDGVRQTGGTMPETGSRLMAVGPRAGSVLAIEGEGIMGERIYRLDVSKGVVSETDKEDVTSELAKINGISVTTRGEVELNCHVGAELPLGIVKIAYGQTLDELKASPACLTPEVRATVGEESVLAVPAKTGAPSGFMKLGFR